MRYNWFATTRIISAEDLSNELNRLDSDGFEVYSISVASFDGYAQNAVKATVIARKAI